MVLAGRHRGRVARVVRVTQKHKTPPAGQRQWGARGRIALSASRPSKGRGPGSTALRRDALQRMVVLQGLGQRRVDRPAGEGKRTSLARSTPINASNVRVLEPGTRRLVRTVPGQRVAAGAGLRAGGSLRRYVDASGRALSETGRPLGRAPPGVAGPRLRPLDALNRPLDAHGERLVDDSPAGRGWPFRLDSRGRPLSANGKPVIIKHAKGAPWEPRTQRKVAHRPRIIAFEAPPVVDEFTRPAPVRVITKPRAGGARVLLRRPRRILYAPVVSARATPLPWTRVRPPKIQAGVGAATFPDIRQSRRPAYDRKTMHALAAAVDRGHASRARALKGELARERRWELARERERLLDVSHWTPSSIAWPGTVNPRARGATHSIPGTREVATDRLDLRYDRHHPRKSFKPKAKVAKEDDKENVRAKRKKAKRQVKARKEPRLSEDILEATRRVLVSAVSGGLLGRLTGRGADEVPRLHWRDPANQSTKARLRRSKERMLEMGRKAEAKGRAKQEAAQNKPHRWRRLYNRTKERIETGDFKAPKTRDRMKQTLGHIKKQYLDKGRVNTIGGLDRRVHRRGRVVTLR